MIIEIKIECDTILEFKGHIMHIFETICMEIGKRGLNEYEDEVPKDLDLSDNNCYGTHEVVIMEDEPNHP